MAAHTVQPTRSRRFIKIYLGTWGLLAVGALGYLAMLTYPPQADTPPQAAAEEPKVAVVPPQTAVEPRRVEVAPRRVAVVPVRVPAAPARSGAPETDPPAQASGSSGDTRKDAAPSQEAAGERATSDDVAPMRPPAPPERVAVDAPQPPPTVPGITILQKPEEKVAETAAPPTGAPPAGDAGKAQEAAAAPATAAPAPFVPIETGSIGPESQPGDPSGNERAASEPTSAIPKEPIVFGEPVVTRARPEFAVQLGASPSLPALRRSWGRLAERHAAALGSLKPRVVSPPTGSSNYRLLAGPVPTLADAQRICTELGVGPDGCYATYYAGAPL